MVLLTGGSGRLGTELQKSINVEAPVQDEFDITHNLENKYFMPTMIIHAAAYTDVGKAQTEQGECYRVNVVGTKNLLRTYPDVPFIYISTEYANDPVNVYGQTKALAEEEVMGHTAPWLILRTLFKPNPFPWGMAFTDQFTQGDYVDVIAKIIAARIKGWDLRSDLEYIGTGRKSMFELAQRTKPDVKPGSVRDFTDYPIPTDYE